MIERGDRDWTQRIELRVDQDTIILSLIPSIECMKWLQWAV
jgi:hypothetical protein